jgi:hypothetical protein
MGRHGRIRGPGQCKTLRSVQANAPHLAARPPQAPKVTGASAAFWRVRIAQARLTPVTAAGAKAAPGAAGAAARTLSLSFQLPAGSLQDVSAVIVELQGGWVEGHMPAGALKKGGRPPWGCFDAALTHSHGDALPRPPPSLPTAPGSFPHQLLFSAGTRGLAGGGGVAFKGAPVLREGKAKM